MWSNNRYAPFLCQRTPPPLAEDWFRWFVGEWKVARTIKDGQQGNVRDYLDKKFRQDLKNGGGAEAVDAAAAHIQQRGWSSQIRKDGQSSLPISLVSKIGFFFCPSKLVPLDRYALLGLNRLRCDSSKPKIAQNPYAEYLSAFNEQFAFMDSRLTAVLKEPWVNTLACKLGCPIGALNSIALRRKLFDDFLMHLGDYRR
jgi:hypothetical protein